MIIRRLLPTLGLISLLAVVPAMAQEKAPVRLTLAECLKMALENNLDLVLARIDPEISAENVHVSGAAFDGILSGSGTRTERTQEATDISRAPGVRTNNFSFAWDQTLNFGASYTATLSTSQTDIDVPPGNFFFTTPREFGSSVALDATLPLLQGFGREFNQEQLLLARTNLDISRDELRRQVHQTLEQVESAYLDVTASRQALRVARESLERAEDLLALNRKKVEVGTLAPIEITQAEAGVASQEEGVIVAETTLRNAEDELRRLLGVPRGDPMWEDAILPVDQPTFERMSPDLEAAITEAMRARPEMNNAERDITSQELQERVAKNRVRHRLDLNVNFTPSGTDVDEFDPGPDMIPGTLDDVQIGSAKLSDAISEISDLENRFWRATLTWAYPIGNKAAKANYRIATLNREKSQASLANLEQTIRVEVRTAVRNVTSGSKRVDAARANVVLQRKKLEAEQKKFENGMSTSFEVLEFQNDLSDAELSEIRAIIGYNKSLIALERAKGTLLEARGLSLGE